MEPPEAVKVTAVPVSLPVPLVWLYAFDATDAPPLL